MQVSGAEGWLASASPLHMLEKVLIMFELRDSFDARRLRKTALQQAASAGLYGLRREGS